MLTTGSDFVIVVIVAATRHGSPPAQIGVMFAIAGAGGILGALAVPWLSRRIRSLRLVAAGAVWVAVPFVTLIAMTTNPYLLGVRLGLTLSV
jgi:predicted MFS family arabinose efflux permease